MADSNGQNDPNKRRPLKLPFDTTDLYDFGFANSLPSNFAKDYNSAELPQAPHLTVTAGSSKVKKPSNKSQQQLSETSRHEDAMRNLLLSQNLEINLPKEMGNGQELVLKNDRSFGTSMNIKHDDISETGTEDSVSSFSYPEPSGPPPPLPPRKPDAKYTMMQTHVMNLSHPNSTSEENCRTVDKAGDPITFPVLQLQPMKKSFNGLEKSVLLRNDVESVHDFFRVESESESKPQEVLCSTTTGMNTICNKNQTFQLNLMSSQNIGAISTEKMISSLSKNLLSTTKNAEILNWLSSEKTISLGARANTNNTNKVSSSNSQDIPSVLVINSDDHFLNSLNKSAENVQDKSAPVTPHDVEQFFETNQQNALTCLLKSISKIKSGDVLKKSKSRLQVAAESKSATRNVFAPNTSESSNPLEEMYFSITPDRASKVKSTTEQNILSEQIIPTEENQTNDAFLADDDHISKEDPFIQNLPDIQPSETQLSELKTDMLFLPVGISETGLPRKPDVIGIGRHLDSYLTRMMSKSFIGSANGESQIEEINTENDEYIPTQIEVAMNIIDITELQKNDLTSLSKEESNPVYHNSKSGTLLQNGLNSLQTNQMPRQTLTYETPSQMLTNQMPSQILTNQMPSQILTNQMPSPILTNQMPRQTLTYETPSQILTNQMPSQILTNQMPSQILTNQMPSQMLTNQMPNQTITTRKLPSGVTVNIIRNSMHGSNFMAVAHVHQEQSSHHLLEHQASSNVASSNATNHNGPTHYLVSNSYPMKSTQATLKPSVMQKQISYMEPVTTEGTSFSDSSIVANKDSVESTTSLTELADSLESEHQPSPFPKKESLSTQMSVKSSRMRRSNTTQVTISPPNDTMTNYMVDILAKVDKKIDIMDNHLIKLSRDSKRPSIISKKNVCFKQSSKLATVAKGKVSQNLEDLKGSKTKNKIVSIRKINSFQNRSGSVQVLPHKQSAQNSGLSITGSQPSKTQRNFVRENILKYSNYVRTPHTSNVTITKSKKTTRVNDLDLSDFLAKNFRKTRAQQSEPITTYVANEEDIREAVRYELAALLEFPPQSNPMHTLKSKQIFQVNTDMEKSKAGMEALSSSKKRNHIPNSRPSTSKGNPS